MPAVERFCGDVVTCFPLHSVRRLLCVHEIMVKNRSFVRGSPANCSPIAITCIIILYNYLVHYHNISYGCTQHCWPSLFQE